VENKDSAGLIVLTELDGVTTPLLTLAQQAQIVAKTTTVLETVNGTDLQSQWSQK